MTDSAYASQLMFGVAGHMRALQFSRVADMPPWSESSCITLSLLISMVSHWCNLNLQQGPATNTSDCAELPDHDIDK